MQTQQLDCLHLYLATGEGLYLFWFLALKDDELTLVRVQCHAHGIEIMLEFLEHHVYCFLKIFLIVTY